MLTSTTLKYSVEIILLNIIQGDILSMIEQEIDSKGVKLDNKTLIKRWFFDDSE